MQPIPDPLLLSHLNQCATSRLTTASCKERRQVQLFGQLTAALILYCAIVSSNSLTAASSFERYAASNGLQ